jgi:hypothetical protein
MLLQGLVGSDLLVEVAQYLPRSQVSVLLRLSKPLRELMLRNDTFWAWFSCLLSPTLTDSNSDTLADFKRFITLNSSGGISSMNRTACQRLW